jgi:2-polyprenyl-3-methyl-5-hydroxy-6-metoxy-1,4-benzoquinol methylase
MKPELFRLHAELEDSHWWFVARRRIIRTVLNELLSHRENASVIDVGCGTGGNIAAFSDGFDCVGIDPVTDAIRFARDRYAGTRFICGIAPTDLEGLAAAADAFLLLDVLEHIEDDRAMLSSLVAAARPGAMFIITVPANPELWSEHDVAFGHYRRYTKSTLPGVWSGLPVRPRLLSYFNARLYPLVWIARAAGRRYTSGCR